MNIKESLRFGVLGLGKTGCSVYQFLQNKAYDVICFDDNESQRKKFALEFPNATIVNLDDNAWLSCDYFVVSPGIALHYPKMHKIAEIANTCNIQIISDIDLFFYFNPNKYYIGITGTNGKSTCTALLAHILQKYGKDFLAVGNIGMPICLAGTNAEGYVIELSSYQLETTKALRLNLALCLDITLDHSDRYETFEDYVNAKFNIFKLLKSDGTAFLSNLSANLKLPVAKYLDIDNIKIINNILYDNYSSRAYALEDNKYLIGEHNNQNIKACYLMSTIFGLNGPEILNAISFFPGLAHRLQYLGARNNMHFYNDSKATNNEATIKALVSLENIYWLAGGLHKTKDFSSLLPVITTVNKAYFFGDAGKDFFAYFSKFIQCKLCHSLEEAFNESYKDAGSSNIKANILLSPASASFDQFKNFEDRGEAFIGLVENIL